jgi:hypothetical protein
MKLSKGINNPIRHERVDESFTCITLLQGNFDFWAPISSKRPLLRGFGTVSIFLKFKDILPWLYEQVKSSLHLKRSWTPSTLSFRTHSKKTPSLNSRDIIFVWQEKAFIFDISGLQKFDETRDIPIIFPKFINTAMNS